MNRSKSIEMILKKNVPNLVTAYFDIILSREEGEEYSEAEKDRIITSYEKHLHAFPIYSPKVLIRTPRDILKQLRRGKITLDEAKAFMVVFKEEFEMDELPKLMEKLEQLSDND